MTSFGHVSGVTILGHTVIGLQDGRHTKRLAQTTKGYSTSKNVVSSIKINRKPVKVVRKQVETHTRCIL